jgi:hypothetical protein
MQTIQKQFYIALAGGFLFVLLALTAGSFDLQEQDSNADLIASADNEPPHLGTIEKAQFIAFSDIAVRAYEGNIINRDALDIIEEFIFNTINDNDDFGSDTDCETLERDILQLIAYYHCNPSAANEY